MNNPSFSFVFLPDKLCIMYKKYNIPLVTVKPSNVFTSYIFLEQVDIYNS
jgi:hypothetical protein